MVGPVRCSGCHGHCGRSAFPAFIKQWRRHGDSGRRGGQHVGLPGPGGDVSGRSLRPVWGAAGEVGRMLRYGLLVTHAQSVFKTLP